ncbi:MAG: hypothetical protein G8237_14690 [Magnetococcales bacterium]|nr:hypothetical protein [Magnetococcales bacterium]
MTIVIVSIIAGVGAVSMLHGFNAYMTAQAIEPLSSSARVAMERLRREIRNAQTCVGISQPGGSGSLQFVNDQGRTILVNQGQQPTDAIYMTFDGVEKLLVPNVKALSLQFAVSPCTLAGPPATLTPGLVTFSFTMTSKTTDGKVLTLPLRTAVYVRST